MQTNADRIFVVSAGTSEKNFLPYLSVQLPSGLSERYIAIKNYRSLHAQSVFDKLLAILGDFIDYRIHLKNMTGRWYLQKKIKLSIGEKIQKWMCVSF